MSKVALTKTKVVRGDINKALKRFKSTTMDSGHLDELKDRKQFLKPSVIKRKKMKDAVRAEKWNLEKSREEY